MGADQLESEFCILYGSSPSAAQSHPICRQPIVLRETVSPHLRLRALELFFFLPFLFFFPLPRRCKQGGAARRSRDVFRRPWNLWAGEGQEDLDRTESLECLHFPENALSCTVVGEGRRGKGLLLPDPHPRILICFPFSFHQLGEANRSKRKQRSRGKNVKIRIFFNSAYCLSGVE